VNSKPIFKDQIIASKGLDSWKVLIADDEQIIHDVTALALKRFVFRNKPLSLYHAYSGAEARDMLRQHPDIAVALLDVVMESDDAGLQTARYIREELHNRFVRIIIRTGQPGAAPEEHIIRDYDINDYKSKSELTIQKLNTTMYSALRMYRDLINIERQRVLLRRAIKLSAKLAEHTQLADFVEEVSTQIMRVLQQSKTNRPQNQHTAFLLAGCNQRLSDCMPTILDGSGRFAELSGMGIDQALQEDEIAIVKKALTRKETVIENGKAVFLSTNKQGDYGLIYFEEFNQDTHLFCDLMQMFSQNLSIAYQQLAFQNT
jgi:CheY-like chemotaxis protein